MWEDVVIKVIQTRKRADILVFTPGVFSAVISVAVFTYP